MQGSPGFELRKIRTAGEVVQDTFVFIRLNAKSFFLTLAIVAGPFLIFQLLCDIFVGFRSSKEYMDFPHYLHNGSGNGSAILANIAVTFLPFLLVIVAVHAFIKTTAIGRNTSIGEVSKFLFADTFRVLTIFFSYIIITPLYFAPALIVPLIPSLKQYLFIMLPVMTGTAVLIFIYLNVRMALIFPVSIFEGKVFFAAMSRSIYYTKGLAGITFFTIVLLLAVAAPLPLLAYFGEKYFWPYGNIPFFAKFITSIMIQLSWVIFITGICLHYFNITERKEHTGANRRIDDIGKSGYNESHVIDESKN